MKQINRAELKRINSRWELLDKQYNEMIYGQIWSMIKKIAVSFQNQYILSQKRSSVNRKAFKRMSRLMH